MSIANSSEVLEELLKLASSKGQSLDNLMKSKLKLNVNFKLLIARRAALFVPSTLSSKLVQIASGDRKGGEQCQINLLSS